MFDVWLSNVQFNSTFYKNTLEETKGLLYPWLLLKPESECIEDQHACYNLLSILIRAGPIQYNLCCLIFTKNSNNRTFVLWNKYWRISNINIYWYHYYCVWFASVILTVIDHGDGGLWSGSHHIMWPRQMETKVYASTGIEKSLHVLLRSYWNYKSGFRGYEKSSMTINEHFPRECNTPICHQCWQLSRRYSG